MVGCVVILAILLLLAGCLDEADTNEADDAGVDAPDGAAETDGTDAVGDDAVGVPAAAPRDEALVWDGSIGTWAVACVPGLCYGGGSGGNGNTLELTGLVAMDVAMTWDTPNELAIGLASECSGSCDFVAWDTGSTSAAISAEDLDPDQEYTLVVWHPFKGANGVGAQAGPATSFHVEGTTMVV